MDAPTMLVVGGAIAALVAITKAAVPGLPARTLPLLVLAYSAAFVGAAYYSGIATGTLFDALVAVVGQAASALGLREAVVTAAPVMSTLPSRPQP